MLSTLAQTWDTTQSSLLGICRSIYSIGQIKGTYEDDTISIKVNDIDNELGFVADIRLVNNSSIQVLLEGKLNKFPKIANIGKEDVNEVNIQLTDLGKTEIPYSIRMGATNTLDSDASKLFTSKYDIRIDNGNGPFHFYILDSDKNYSHQIASILSHADSHLRGILFTIAPENL